MDRDLSSTLPQKDPENETIAKCISRCIYSSLWFSYDATYEALAAEAHSLSKTLFTDVDSALVRYLSTANGSPQSPFACLSQVAAAAVLSCIAHAHGGSSRLWGCRSFEIT